MIEVMGLRKVYGDKVAVDNVSFTAHKGEILGFLGPNGAGKSTTIRMLAGYIPPSSGRATIAGFDTFADSLEARRHIGYLPESTPLYTDLPVWTYLDYMAALKGVPAKQRKSRILDVIKRCWLEGREYTIIGRLSKGYRQRVGLAQALIHNPEVLLLDEPTDGLDPNQIVETRGLIRDLAKDHTVIMASHILAEVAVTCERVVIINEGRVVAEDRPADLAERFSPNRRLLRLEIAGYDDVVRPLSAIDGVLEVSDQGVTESGGRVIHVLIEREREDLIRTAMVRLISQGHWVLRTLQDARLDLEGVFQKLTHKGGDIAG